MSRTTHDSPYRDDKPSPTAAPTRSSPSRPARKSSARPRQQDHQRKPSQPGSRAGVRGEGAAGRHASNGTPRSHASNGSAAATGAQGPYAPRPSRDARTRDTRPTPRATPAAPPITTATAAPAGRRRSRRRGRGKGTGAPQIQLTSHPTGRAAYADTRAWLLQEHGAVCAYCAREFAPEVMTLDHVAPRRGQTAYDRRDNLVLACRPCNEAKRDLSPLAYLLAVRSRAANLLRYGAHLSPGLLDLARSLLPKGHHAHTAHVHGSDAANGAHAGNGADGKRPAREIFGITDDDEGESPYRD